MPEVAIAAAQKLIARFEGCALQKRDGLIYPYICPAGYPTQGYGILVKDMAVAPITKEEAEARLVSAIPYYMGVALRHSPGLIKYPLKLAAITSFVFNLGASRYSASTLKKRVNEEDWGAAVIELGKWVNGGGRKLPGLVLRRAAEAQYLQG